MIEISFKDDQEFKTMPDILHLITGIAVINNVEVRYSSRPYVIQTHFIGDNAEYAEKELLKCL